jgi:hypothetical protein
MKSPSNAAVAWLEELIEVADRLPQFSEPKPYWSQRAAVAAGQNPDALTTQATAMRVRAVADDFERQRYFTKFIGYDCYDDAEALVSSMPEQFDRRVGKGELWTADPQSWTEDDLCDFIEVLHDLVARPTREWYHNWNGCGLHPKAWSIPAGRRLYTWSVNQILERSVVGLLLADDGEDAGRMVRAAPSAVNELVASMVTAHIDGQGEVVHAISMFRDRHATRDSQRSAIVALARVLEDRRKLLDQRLFKKDAADLFELANRYDLRHRNDGQKSDYGDEFLPWIFYYYLVTIQLTDDLLTSQRPPRP